MKTTKQVLLDAADLIDRRHCKRAGARDSQGEQCSPRSPAAVCWCAVGALEASCGETSTLSLASSFLCRAVGIPRISLVDWNDAPERTAAEVSGAMRNAASVA